MFVLWLLVALLALIVALVLAAAWSDRKWQRRGFRTEIRGKGRNKVKVRVRLDPTVPMPEDASLFEQDWVRTRDLWEPDDGEGTEPSPQGG